MLTLGMVEVAFRGVEYYLSPRCICDDVLGWRNASHLTKHKKGIRSDGKVYDIVISLDEHGFRPWSQPQADKRRLLVVGDSFTEASQVSDEKTYYAVLARKLGPQWQLFAYGSSGYGTLQEYMVLDRHWDTIRPDLVLWQWCANDFCNNLFEWDNQTKANFITRPRPYWERGRIVMRCPREVPILSWHSHFFLWLRPYLHWRSNDRPRAAVDDSGAESPIFQRAEAVTDELVGLTRRRMGRTPAFAFIAHTDAAGPYLDAFQRIADHHQIKLIRGVNRRLRETEERGIPMQAHASIGGHWSEEGHGIVADLLYEAVAQQAQMIAQPPPPSVSTTPAQKKP